MVFGSPKKTVDNNINKIEKGQGSKKIVDSLNKALKENPELVSSQPYNVSKYAINTHYNLTL